MGNARAAVAIQVSGIEHGDIDRARVDTLRKYVQELEGMQGVEVYLGDEWTVSRWSSSSPSEGGSAQTELLVFPHPGPGRVRGYTGFCCGFVRCRLAGSWSGFPPQGTPK